MVAMESSTSAQFVSESVTVNITVLDVNDNAPYFIQNKYSVGRNQYGTTIRQNLKAGTVIMEVSITFMFLKLLGVTPTKEIANHNKGDMKTDYLDYVVVIFSCLGCLFQWPRGIIGGLLKMLDSRGLK